MCDGCTGFGSPATTLIVSEQESVLEMCEDGGSSSSEPETLLMFFK